MPTVWRVVKRRHVRSAFDGEGARRFGGRWSSPGNRAVYTSASKSLATLEILVHLEVGRPLPRLVAFAFDIPESLVERLPANRLPRSWRTLVGIPATRRLGDEFLTSGRALALAVPSAIVPEETNYVLNPGHPAFSRLRVGRPVSFLLDPRLVRSR